MRLLVRLGLVAATAVFTSTTAFTAGTPPPAPLQKADPWVEVRSPNFTVLSNGSEKQARATAGQFEQFRSVFQYIFPKARLDNGIPLTVFAMKNESGMKAMVPQYWEKSGAARPAGVYFSGSERNFVVLNLGADTELAKQVIYHEFAHQLNRLNFGTLPAWLDEGLAEVFAHAILGDKQSTLGRVTEDQQLYLQQERLLPLEAILTADHKSPYYNEEEKASIFYAQSWAMAHWLLLGNRGTNFPKMSVYLDLLEKGTPAREAAAKAFGNLQSLGLELEAYARQENFFMIQVKAPTGIDEKTFAARPLPEAESLAARGDFYVRAGRNKEALTALNEAYKLNPAFGPTNESLGNYYLRNNDRETAAKHFATAVKSDSASFMAYYLYANLTRNARDAAALQETETNLRKAIQLNANYAPAYSMLANTIAIRATSATAPGLEEGLSLAVKAALLEPGVPNHRAVVVAVLIRMERADEALSMAERLMQSAKNDQERTQFASLADNARRLKTYVDQRRRATEEPDDFIRRAEERQSQLRRGEPTVSATATVAVDSVVAPTVVPVAPPNTGRVASLEGALVEASCPSPNALVVQIQVDGKTLRFRTENYFQVEFFSVGWTPPDNFQPCTQMPKPLRIIVEHTPTPGSDYAGTIRSIEMRKQ